MKIVHLQRRTITIPLTAYVILKFINILEKGHNDHNFVSGGRANFYILRTKEIWEADDSAEGLVDYYTVAHGSWVKSKGA